MSVVASRLPALLPVIAACTTLTCSPGDRSAALSEVSDSAGIRLVAIREGPERQLSVGDRPLMTIGDGRDSVTLYRVSGGILRPGNGDVVLANAGSSEVFVVNIEGRLINRIGGPGDGPGEFGSIAWIEARADGGFHVGDSQHRRVTAFDENGEVLWTRSYNPQPETPAEPNALLAPGFVLHSTDEGVLLAFPTAMGLPDGQPGLLPMVGRLRRYPAEQDGFEEVGPITVLTWYEDPTAGSIPLGSMLGGSRLEYAAHSGRFAHTEGATHQIDVFDRGVRSMRIREVRPRIRFEPDSVPAGVVHVADSIPAYQDIRVDSQHRIWVQSAVDPARTRTEWRVFGADGMPIGSLALPYEFEILDASQDRLLVLTRDDLDVESVELLEVAWPTAG